MGPELMNPRAAEVRADAVATATSRPRRLHWLLLGLILLVSGGAMAIAMRATSTTFDEVVFIAAGARGLATGEFDLAPDHPPLMQYVYGLPAHLAGAVLPDETPVPDDVKRQVGYRYAYASTFFWYSGNDPERMAFLGRLPAVLMALGLVAAVFMFVARYRGAAAALLAAALVAFLPDVLGHGGVAYSDVPVTLALFCGVWAIDRAVRAPSWVRGALAGAVSGLAIGVKISAAILVPCAAALVLLELIGRRREPGSLLPWARSVAIAAGVAVITAYLAIVVIYRGDFMLEQFRFGLDYRYRHMTGGHGGATAFLLGERSTTGWWYFFPVAFLFKTSAGLHALLLIALAAFISGPRDLQRICRSSLRAAVVVIVLFGAVLLGSSLNIGFRYAMPVLPWICVVAAVGVQRAWEKWRVTRPAIVAFTIWTIAFPLTFFPNFLSFISEYGPNRDRSHDVLVDSNLDWGQGLLQLRAFMHRHDIPSVYLSYFGSGSPTGYGIPHVPLPSFFPLPPAPPLAEPPAWVAISATNLAGAYLADDPFARLRDVDPDAVVGGSILVYRLDRVPQ